ncbi:Amidohydrolase 2 [Niveomyces insectorum RCEF 264]|uniref:Amidohydrolase 2 n=1 Tax=Niveomyces insectorum RCEF 264 TaxID=1081102 RepID=A0A167T7R6_9HYPO|nr:Amidohydrolase 2 [Niveomyces insectorum RCEF 264]
MDSHSDSRSGDLLPKGSWDCHHHIYDPHAFAYSPTRHMTVPPATVAQYVAFKKAHGIDNSVLTHGLSYGADNTSLLAFLDGLKKADPGHCTLGVAVIDPDTTTDAELVALRDGGVCGIRVNTYRYGALEDVDRQIAVLRAHATRLQAAGETTAGWSMAFTTTKPGNWTRLRSFVETEIAAASVRLVTDHFALLQLPENGSGELDLHQPGLEAIIALVRAGVLWVKLSAPYRLTKLPPSGGFADLKLLVRVLVDANPKRVIWGTDWPHTPKMQIRTPEEALKEVPFLKVDDQLWLKTLRSWLSEDEWVDLMVNNPRELYNVA